MKKGFLIPFDQGFLMAMSPKEALEACSNGYILLDVREEYHHGYKHFQVPGCLTIPFTQLKDRLGKLEKDAGYVVGDATGIWSKEACKLLESEGFQKVAMLAGGIVEWERDGCPLSRDPGGELSGSCMCQLKTPKRPKD